MARQITTTIRSTAMLTCISLLLVGCASAPDWIKDRITPGGGNEELVLGAPDLDEYVDELGKIASGDPAAQAEIYADASSAAQLTPSPATRLRLGLVLAVPGHPESDPDTAVNLLRDVLTETELLTAAEISLAQVLLNSAERQIVASSEVRQLRASTSLAQQTQQQAVNQRLSTVEAENRRLRRELEDANQKIEDLTLIERDIRER